MIPSFWGGLSFVMFVGAVAWPRGRPGEHAPRPAGCPTAMETTRAPRERSTHAARAHTLRRARPQVALIRRREAG